MRGHDGQRGPESFDGSWPEHRVPAPSDHDAGSMHIPDHLVDRFFDRELTRGEATEMFESFRSDPDAARRFVQTQRMLDALREPVRAPDLSRAILAQVEQRTPMLTRRGVRHVRAGRFVAAAALVSLIAGAFVMQRLNPRMVEIGSDQARPLAALRATMSVDAADAMYTIQQTTRALGDTASRAMSLPVQPPSCDTPRSAASVWPARDETVGFVRARLLPDVLLPWHQRSSAPAEGKVAWVVPCGTAPKASASGADATPCSSSLILVDFKNASADLPRTPQGRSSIAK